MAGENVNIRSILAVVASVATGCIMLAGCATRPAPDFHGRWRPVNHYADAPQAIPLNPAYVFEAAPMDGTLKNMLTRWAKDSKMTLSYLASMDYTLYQPVSDIHTTSLPQALGLVNAAYAAEGITTQVSGNQIVVRVSSSGVAPAGSGK